MKENNILNSVDGPQGFYDGLTLSGKDTEELQHIVHEHFSSQLAAKYPEITKEIKNLKMDQYHIFLHNNPQVSHSDLAAKKNRILPSNLTKRFRELEFFKRLEQELGEIKITNEEGIYKEEIYWRLTRPGHNDVGPMHADKWFWDLGHGTSSKKQRRLKIWISIYNETGKNGLRYVYGSHLKEWPYHGEERDGFVKPMIDISNEDLDITKFLSHPGKAFIFNDSLLHGGFSGGERSRVSIECTMLLKV